jgi:hypothetical protein
MKEARGKVIRTSAERHAPLMGRPAAAVVSTLLFLLLSASSGAAVATGISGGGGGGVRRRGTHHHFAGRALQEGDGGGNTDGETVPVVVDDEWADNIPEGYQDDIYHCKDPQDGGNVITCDADTYTWDLAELDPLASPDDSERCWEVVQILSEAEKEADGDSTGSGMTVQELMDTIVTDALEPCVLWAMTYGDLLVTVEEGGSSTGGEAGEEGQSIRVCFWIGSYCCLWRSCIRCPRARC